MNEKGISNIIDALYTRFLLRDLFGKVTSGAIVLIPIVFLAIEYLGICEKEILQIFFNITFWVWLVLIGILWTIGFAIQQVGIKSKMISDYPDNKIINRTKIENKNIWYEKYNEFTEKANDHQKRNLERFFIIKEACGNGHIAFLILLIILIVNLKYKLVLVIISSYSFYNPMLMIPFYGTLLIMILLVAIWLKDMHEEQIENIVDYMNVCFEKFDDCKYNCKFTGYN